MKTVKDIKLTNYDNEEKRFEMYIDARALMTFEKIYRLESGNKKATFINSLEDLQYCDMTLIACLMASTLRKEGKKQPVGLDFIVENISPLENMQSFILALKECLVDLKIDEDKDDKGK